MRSDENKRCPLTPTNESTMNKAKQILINILLATGWIFIVVSSFLAYFVSSFDEIKKVPIDGLGRKLTEAPFLAKIFLLGSDRWAGLDWMIIEYIVFWGFTALTVVLLKQEEKLEL